MNTAAYVDNLIADLKQQVQSKQITLSQAVWKTAKACLEWPYVWSAWGDECTPSERKKRHRTDHDTYKNCQVCSGSKSSCAGCKWLPGGNRVRCYDCRGFTAWCIRQFGLNIEGSIVSTQWNNNNNWARKDTIASMPQNQLVCLFQRTADGKWLHTGLGYNKETCECQKGVQYFANRDPKWTHWAIPKGLDQGGVEPVDWKPTIRRGDRGEYVTLAQVKLKDAGYDIGKSGADGIFGAATQTAVKNFQRDHGLGVDGVVGPMTWDALDNQPTIQLYTVHIPTMPLYKAEALVQSYSGAWMTKEGAD